MNKSLLIILIGKTQTTNIEHDEDEILAIHRMMESADYLEEFGNLFAQINEHEVSVLMLEIEGTNYELCDYWEYGQGNEKLCTYTVLDFYSAVVKRVFEMLEAGLIKFLDLERIKDELMPQFWAQWRERGWVRHNHWK